MLMFLYSRRKLKEILMLFFLLQDGNTTKEKVRNRALLTNKYFLRWKIDAINTVAKYEISASAITSILQSLSIKYRYIFRWVKIAIPHNLHLLFTSCKQNLSFCHFVFLSEFPSGSYTVARGHGSEFGRLCAKLSLMHRFCNYIGFSRHTVYAKHKVIINLS